MSHEWTFCKYLPHPTAKQMEYAFPKNTNDCNVVYHRQRIGKNYFRVYYKQGCCIRFTPKEVGRVFGVAKFTTWVNECREWCKEMIDKYESRSSLKDDPDSTVSIDKEKGFGPECHEEEPNDNTKMVI